LSQRCSRRATRHSFRERGRESKEGKTNFVRKEASEREVTPRSRRRVEREGLDWMG